MARGEIRPAGGPEAIELVRGFIREETARRLERDRGRAVRAALEGVASRHQRRRVAILISTSYGVAEVG